MQLKLKVLSNIRFSAQSILLCNILFIYNFAYKDNIRQ